MRFYIFAIFIFVAKSLTAQSDTTKYPWPTPLFNVSKGLNATFGEFRNTGNADHFHNAVDIGEPDGNPVYPSLNGTVHYYSNNGYDSYINVKTIINGQKKHMTYYHVVPSPSLFIGQEVIAGETIIGTIYNGAAHVHLIEREWQPASSSNLGNEINPVRPEGGLYPYTDIYPPRIIESSLKFYKDKTSIPLPGDQLTGKIDIRIEVREENGTSFSQKNNGTYILGYRILSVDGNSIIYEPDNEGIKYRFYYIPGDGYVHQAFVKDIATLSDPIYWLTNGNGEAQINSTFTIPNNFLDTDLLNEGNYQLEIFSEDTRGNSVSQKFPISIIKLPPELRTVIAANDTIKVSWHTYNLNNLEGYRLYYSDNKELNNWELAADETLLSDSVTAAVFNGPAEFIVPSENDELYFYLTAVDEQGFESAPSDIYSLSINANESPKTLIVDGFDRYGGSGSWDQPQHSFNKIYYDAILSNFPHNISSCSNESVIDEEVNLQDYDIVVWFLGDESIADNTLINSEQRSLAFFLESGGKLFISGEDIGKDLDTKHEFNDFSDTLFYHQYLKAKLIHDGLDLLYEVDGEQGTNFENLNVQFGGNYPVEAPDDIEPINGAHPILNYRYERDGTYRKGGIAFHGAFGKSSAIGTLVYLSFPFESISDESIRNELYKRIQNYFDNGPVSVNQNKILQNSFQLYQNYPNPFNPSTKIKYSLPYENGVGLEAVSVNLTIYDMLGRKVITLVNEEQRPGNHEAVFNISSVGRSISSGVYYYRIIASDFMETRKMILLK